MMLSIPLLNGETWKVRAKVVGDLALHRMRIDGKQWSVTHVPTLLSFTAAVPREVRGDRGRLLQWMAAAQHPAMKLHWDMLRESDPKVLLNQPTPAMQYARNVVFDYCQRVSI